MHYLMTNSLIAFSVGNHKRKVNMLSFSLHHHSL